MTRSSEGKLSDRRASFIVGLSIEILETADGRVLVADQLIAAILTSGPCRPPALGVGPDQGDSIWKIIAAEPKEGKRLLGIQLYSTCQP